jgi:hypothetical protein
MGLWLGRGQLSCRFTSTTVTHATLELISASLRFSSRLHRDEHCLCACQKTVTGEVQVKGIPVTGQTNEYTTAFILTQCEWVPKITFDSANNFLPTNPKQSQFFLQSLTNTSKILFNLFFINTFLTEPYIDSSRIIILRRVLWKIAESLMEQ